MRAISFNFQIHQPVKHRTYRFFDIGYNHYYYNDFETKTNIKRIAQRCYIPMNSILEELIKEYGSKFKASFSLSGLVISQLEQYAPEVIESFKRLAKTKCIEFIACPYAYSLASLKDMEEFKAQVNKHAEKIYELFGQKPTTFKNTEFIYSDEIGESVYEMGYNLMLTEGAKHILGWKSPNYMYCNATNPKLKLLLRNNQLSDDIGFRFSRQDWIEWPLTSEKFVNWLNNTDKNEEVVNINLDYSVFGEFQSQETGIFEFFKALPRRILSHSDFSIMTPAEIAKKLQPISPIYVPHPISWADEERDLTAWLGNELQNEAFEKLYYLAEKIRHCSDPYIHYDWENLQSSDHLYYMSTKWFSDGAIQRFQNPFGSPYEAFINFMNILSDFEVRVYRDCMKNNSEFKEEKTEEIVKKETIKTKNNSLKAETPKTNLEKKVRKSTFKLKPFTFSELNKLPDVTIKEILKSTDADTIAFALKGAKAELKNKCYEIVGKRITKRIEEILNNSEAITREQTKLSRNKIESIAQKLI